MVSRVGIIVFIIRGSFFEVYGEKEKKKRISWSRLLYEFFMESLGNQGFSGV